MLTHQKLIAAMTLEEKVSLLSGANFWHTKSIERLNVPSIMMTDGPHGLRKQAGKSDHLGLNKSVPATCFPTAAALAASWDTSLVERVGEAIGHEAAANEVGAVMGPGLNIVRDPLAGRAFEYYSEDPYVSGKMAAAMARGIQLSGVAATPKHFAVNSQEYLRMSIDEVVDERTLHEIYLEGFRRVVVEAQPKLLMTSYNKVNGVYANEHQHLIDDILRKAWGYKGAIVTDWGGNNDPVAAIKAGAALEMPSSNGLTEAVLIEAVRSGDLEESIVDERVNTLLTLVFDATKAVAAAKRVDYEAHQKLAIEAAERSMVLLENKDRTLPLAKHTRVALVGDFAELPRYQGAGSSLVNPTELVSALDAFANDSSLKLVGYEPGFKRAGGKSAKLLRRAVSLAKGADAVVVYLGLDEAKEAEGIDRKDMRLAENQLELLDAICEVHDTVIVVLAAGGALELPFANKVQALIQGSLAGQASGVALVNIMTGRRNPSGKLAVSYPYVHADAPTAHFFPGLERTAEHREGLYVGYRYYETADVAVRYPFGYGLSYTAFSYEKIRASRAELSVDVVNAGDVAGEEIVQVYVRPINPSCFRPVHELKGFAKVFLKPGEKRRVSVQLDDHAFAQYDTKSSGWVTFAGEYVIEVGASVRDIRLEKKLFVDGATTPKHRISAPEVYTTGRVQYASRADFEKILGRPLPSAKWNRRTALRYEDTVGQLAHGSLARGRFLVWVMRRAQSVLFALNKPYVANNVEFLINLPLSKIPALTGGRVSETRIKHFLKIRN